MQLILFISISALFIVGACCIGYNMILSKKIELIRELIRKGVANPKVNLFDLLEMKVRIKTPSHLHGDNLENDEIIRLKALTKRIGIVAALCLLGFILCLILSEQI